VVEAPRDSHKHPEHGFQRLLTFLQVGDFAETTPSLEQRILHEGFREHARRPGLGVFVLVNPVVTQRAYNRFPVSHCNLSSLG
jgi:hypothetical protein